jgi:hypothetical protein
MMTYLDIILALFCAFVAGVSIGVLLSISYVQRMRRRWLADRAESFDPTKPPPFPIGESVGKKPPLEVELSDQFVAHMKKEWERVPGPKIVNLDADTFTRDENKFEEIPVTKPG